MGTLSRIGGLETSDQTSFITNSWQLNNKNMKIHKRSWTVCSYTDREHCQPLKFQQYEHYYERERQKSSAFMLGLRPDIYMQVKFTTPKQLKDALEIANNAWQ